MPSVPERLEALASRLRDITSQFPAGKSVDVPKYLEEHGNPEGAKKWREEHEKNKDNFKGGTMATGDKAEYTEYFKKKMKEHGLDGIEGVDDAKLKKFYEDVDAGWKSDKESSEAQPDIPGRLSSLAAAIRQASSKE